MDVSSRMLMVIERHQRTLGIDSLKSWLFQKYCEERRSLRYIMDLLGTKSNHTVMKLLRYFEIPIRHGSDAVKTQWENNESRRKFQAEKMQEMFAGKPAWNRGRTVLTGDKIATWLSETRRGAGNPQWDSELTDEQRQERQKLKRERKDPGYRAWRISVYRRDGFTCRICKNKLSGNLIAHHLDSYTHVKELRTQITNGITLCRTCHNEFHKKYGNRNNSTEQFSEFFYFKTGKKFKTTIQLALF